MKPRAIKELTRVQQEVLATTMLYQEVYKRSKKPFKSGLLINSVKGFEYMHDLSMIRGKPVIGLKFFEDTSVVEISIIKVVT